MKTIKITIATLLLSSITFLTSAQNTEGVRIGNDVSPPHSSAMLEVESNNKGILIPRVNIENLNTPDPVNAPKESLLVFNTNYSTGRGYYYWDDDQGGNTQGFWVKLGAGDETGGSSLWSEATNGTDIFRTNLNSKILIGSNTSSLTPIDSKFQIHGTYPDLSLNGPSGSMKITQVGTGARQHHYGGGLTIFLDAEADIVDENSFEGQFLITHNTSFLSSGREDLFSVTETGDIWSLGTLVHGSDSSLKQNIVPMVSVLDKIKQSNPVNYSLKSSPNMTTSGVIAQEIELLFPNLVCDHNEYGEDGNITRTIKGVNYDGLTSVLLKATKEQQVLIEQLQNTIQLLEQRIATLESN